MVCDRCGKDIQVPKGSTTPGYGTTPEGEIHCFACCGDIDRETMRTQDRITLYLVKADGRWQVTNWPGTLKIPAQVTEGRHNWARVQCSIKFQFEGQTWFGRQVGDHSQIAHCRKARKLK